jgi:HEAT repeat protein
MALNDGEGWVRRLAEKVLVQIGKEAVVLLIKMLEDGDTRQRTDVARVLGTIGDVRAVEPLIMALSSGERQVRNEAANALGAIGDVRAVESLVCALLNRDAELRRRAANALEKIGWEPRDNRECALRAVALRDWTEARRLGGAAVEPLLVAFEGTSSENYGDDSVYAGAAMTLGEICDVRALRSMVLGISKGGGNWQKEETLRASQQIGKENLKSLSALLNDGDSEVRQNAVRALKTIGKAAMEPLIGALKHRDMDVQRSAAGALGQIGDVRAVKPLIESLKHMTIWQTVIEALAKIGEVAVEPLIGVLSDNNWHLRVRAAKVLNKIGWEPKDEIQRAAQAVADQNWEEAKRLGLVAVEPLIGLLTDIHSDSSWRVKHALEAIGKAAMGPLIVSLNNNDKVVRKTAADILGVIGDSQAVEPLIKVLRDDNEWWVRLSAAEALTNINDASAVWAFTTALRDSDWRVRKQAKKALETIGNTAIESLVTSLHSSDRDRRDRAAEALGWLGDPRGMSWLIKRCAEPRCAALALSLLHKMLEVPERLMEEDLRAIINLTGVAYISLKPVCAFTIEKEEPADCSLMKQLVRQELIRRGLRA